MLRKFWDFAPKPISLNLDTSNKILDICKDRVKIPRKDISVELILTKLWFIWKERCNRAVEGKSKNATSLALEIQGHISFRSKKDVYLLGLKRFLKR